MAILSNAEIVAAIDRVIGVPVNNQGPCWLPGGHIVVVRVQGRHNGGIGVLFRAGEIGLGVLHLVRDGLHPPVDGLVLQDVLHAGIARHDLGLAQVHLAEIVDVLVGAVLDVGVGHILRHAGGQVIGGLRDVLARLALFPHKKLFARGEALGGPGGKGC